MTDYEYIIKQARKFHYSKWTDEELRKCIDMLVGLDRQELVSLYMSRWIAEEKILKEEIFKILYADKLGKREERIKEMELKELIEEFQDKKSGNVSLIRNELKHRYKEGLDEEKIIIANAFKESRSKGDQQWIELQLRRELYGNSNGIK
jgi:lysine/ornithine N-monooxygenase